MTCLADVTAPLLGPGGAAAVYGPQKGANPPQIYGTTVEDLIARATE